MEYYNVAPWYYNKLYAEKYLYVYVKFDSTFILQLLLFVVQTMQVHINWPYFLSTSNTNIKNQYILIITHCQRWIKNVLDIMTHRRFKNETCRCNQILRKAALLRTFLPDLGRFPFISYPNILIMAYCERYSVEF